MRRVASLLLTLGLLALAAPAGAAGTGGIEISPYPGVVNGHEITAFHVAVPSSGHATVRYSMRNTTDGPVTGRVYAASATSDGHGGWTVGPAGSAKHVKLPDQVVTLTPHEVRLATFAVTGPVHGRPDEAVVVEVRNGAVVARAATLVYLKPGRRVPLPVLVVGFAVFAAVLTGIGVMVARRRG